jgi:hypothetical protein
VSEHTGGAAAMRGWEGGQRGGRGGGWFPDCGDDFAQWLLKSYIIPEKSSIGRFLLLIVRG